MTAGRLGARLVVAGLAVLSFAPLVNWIANERSAPWYPASLRHWIAGTAVVLGVAIVLAILSRRSVSLWREGGAAEALAVLDPARPRATLVVAAAAGLVYLAIAGLIFDGRPLQIDGVVQLVQARMLAHGRLWIPVDPDPAFRSILHLVDRDGRWFGHFPPGWPLLLAVGELIRSPWIVAPVTGAVSVGAWGAVLRRIDAPPSVRAGALLLFAFAPFTAFMAGSHMNHPAALMWILLAVAGFLRLLERPSVARGVAVGLAVGMAAITRPADALAFAIPAAVWLVARCRRTRAWAPIATVALGLVPPIAFLLATNEATTGSPFLSGYQLLWGHGVGLGFHPVPWGPPHTPLRGLELINLYLLRLDNGLFETPIPGMLFPLAALYFAPKLEALDRYLLASAGVLLALYFAYWHDGFYLGPRFVYPLAPVLALWTARLPRAVLAGTRSETAGRVAAFALGLSAIGAAATGLPTRAAIYAASQPTMRFDPDRAAARAGVADAVVLVQESWGAQLLARLWALGVPKPDADRIYRNTDTCLLEQALGGIEGAGVRGPAAGSRLEPAMADSARLVASPFSPDTSERVLNGARYGPTCIARINEDRAGFTLFAPLWLARRPDVLYVRNLHERNARLLARYPGRKLYRLTQGRDDPVPKFVPIDRDSVLSGAR